MAARRKPGLSIAESDRHTVQRKIRLTPAESAALDSVAEARGVNVSRAVGGLAVEEAYHVACVARVISAAAPARRR